MKVFQDFFFIWKVASSIYYQLSNQLFFLLVKLNDFNKKGSLPFVSDKLYFKL